MILVDTSVWIDHFRRPDPDLAMLFRQAQILLHPFVIGELAMGRLRQRDMVIAELSRQPQALTASNDEVLAFVARYALFSRGLGSIGAHLLVPVRLHSRSTLWTRDRRLLDAASSLGVATTV